MESITLQQGNKPKVVVISGASRSGKSRLSQVLMKESGYIMTICQDAYWQWEINGSQEHVNCTNWQKLVSDFEKAKQNLKDD